MRVLTDTHALVWALTAPETLTATARETLGQSEVLASIANLWELLLKRPKKDALVAEPLAWWDKYVVKTGIPVLSIRAAHVIALGSLPDLHKDPFDRILITQSLVEKAPLVSKDAQLARYGISIIW